MALQQIDDILLQLYTFCFIVLFIQQHQEQYDTSAAQSLAIL